MLALDYISSALTYIAYLFLYAQTARMNLMFDLISLGAV